MVKETTKELVRQFIKDEGKRLLNWSYYGWNNTFRISLKEVLGREQFYRQSKLPVEINNIIENEILNEIWQGIEAEIETQHTISIISELKETTLKIRQSEISLRKSEWEREKTRVKKLIWLIRIIRGEAQITNYPKNTIETAFLLMKLEKSLEEAERLRLEEKQREKEEKEKREAETQQLKSDLEQKLIKKHGLKNYQAAKQKTEQWAQENLITAKRNTKREKVNQEEATENKNNEEEKAKEKRKAKLDQLEKETNELIDNLKEAKEYAKDAYEWLPPKARYWVKIGILIIVIIAVIWGFKYIIRGLKYMLRFLKWIWNNIVPLINEIKSLFSKEKKEGKSTTKKEKNNPEKVLDNPITDNKESKKLEDEKNKKNRRKNKRNKKKER